MIKVLIPGSFDLVHIGHFNVIKSASEKGDYLIVAIHVDSLQRKGVEYFYSPQERADFIKEFRFVDQVLFYETIDQLVRNVYFDILCHGPDNTSDSCLKAYEWCKANNKKLYTLPRTEGISSSKLRKFISIHEI